MYNRGNNAQMNQKPEYVLRRANDLINTAIGNPDREKRLALDQIHAHISLRRGKNQSVWNKTYELLMKRHLELGRHRLDGASGARTERGPLTPP